MSVGSELFRGLMLDMYGPDSFQKYASDLVDYENGITMRKGLINERDSSSAYLVFKSLLDCLIRSPYSFEAS